MNKQNETYKMRAKCNNCGEEWVINISKGISVDTMHERAKCSYCGCNDITIKLLRGR